LKCIAVLFTMRALKLNTSENKLNTTTTKRKLISLCSTKNYLTRMWGDAQRDGCLAEYRWRPLFNAANFGLRPLLEYRAVTLRNPLKLAGVPQTNERISATREPSSPYCSDMWRRYCCLTSFFPDCRYMP